MSEKFGKYPYKDLAIVDAFRAKNMNHIDSYQVVAIENNGLPSKDASKNTKVVSIDKGFYSIHVSSFRNEKRARLDVSNFAKLNYDAFYRSVQLPEKGRWYRVYIGRYKSRNEAVKEKKLFVSRNLVDRPIIVFIEDITHGESPASNAPVSTTSIDEAQKSTPEDHTILNQESSEDISPIPSDPASDMPSQKEVIIDSNESIKENDITSFSMDDQLKQAENDKMHVVDASLILEEIEKSRFSLAMKTGMLYAYGVEDFEIDNDRTVMAISGETVTSAAFAASLNLTSSIVLDASIEKLFADGIDSWMMAFGSRFIMAKWKKRLPYFRISIITGNFDWEDAPGDFNNGIGWELASGINLIDLAFNIGLEANYRNIKFDYNLPDSQNVSANSEDIDFSGFTLSVFAEYRL